MLAHCAICRAMQICLSRPHCRGAAKTGQKLRENLEIVNREIPRGPARNSFIAVSVIDPMYINTLTFLFSICNIRTIAIKPVVQRRIIEEASC